MSDRPPDDDPPPSPEELAAATRLGDALDGLPAAPASPEEARLLARAEAIRALGPGSEDPAGLARVRAELLGRPLPQADRLRALAGLAAAFLVGTLTGWGSAGLAHPPIPPPSPPAPAVALAHPWPGLPGLPPGLVLAALPRPGLARLPQLPSTRGLLDQLARRPLRGAP